MKVFTLFTGIILLFFSNNCSKPENLETGNFQLEISGPVKIGYCELADNPGKYGGQTIILKGVYMLRYHASSFFSFGCDPKIRIVGDFDAPPCNEKSEIEKWDWSSTMLDRAHGVEVKGWLDPKPVKGQTTGAPPEYFRFHVDCIEKVKQLGTFVVFPKSEAEIVKQRIEQFERE